MTTQNDITSQMRILEVEILRQQSYISKHGESNDLGELDSQWEQYKNEAEYNLNKWDSMKKIRDGIK